MSVIITASRWPVDDPFGCSGSEDAVDRRAADAGESVYPVLANACRDGSAHSRIPVAGHGDPLNEPPPA
jgi:hypothetical protein